MMYVEVEKLTEFYTDGYEQEEIPPPKKKSEYLCLNGLGLTGISGAVSNILLGE